MFPTLHQICDRTRALLDDIEEKQYTDDALLEVANQTYLEIQDRLAQAGITSQIKTDNRDLTVGQTVLSADSTPALFDDLIVPHKIWERKTGSGEKFIPMDKLVDGMPDASQSERLRYWEWVNQTIVFIGSTTTVTVRIRYEQQFSEMTLTGATAVAKIRGCKEAMAYGIAAICKPSEQKSRKRADGTSFEAGFERHVKMLIARNIRPEQRVTRRRRPFSMTGPGVRTPRMFF